MANRVVISRPNGNGSAAIRTIYGDTFAGLPTTEMQPGVQAWAVDTAELYQWNGAAWVVTGSGGGGGTTNNYFPAGWS
jgi:hypothetical protein